MRLFPNMAENREIVRRMFDRGICTLHTWSERDEIVAMALTALNLRARMLVIDYLAVRRTWRGQGVGRLCIENIRDWALTSMPDTRGIVIEVEAEETKENAERVLFWEKVGFRNGLRSFLYLGSRDVSGYVS